MPLFIAHLKCSDLVKTKMLIDQAVWTLHRVFKNVLRANIFTIYIVPKRLNPFKMFVVSPKYCILRDLIIGITKLDCYYTIFGLGDKPPPFPSNTFFLGYPNELSVKMDILILQ